MKPPDWLAELHRQWFTARGKMLTARSRAFRRDWNDLLDAAGMTKAEDVATAGREAAKLHEEKRIILTRNRYRHHLIESVALPVSSEAWLRQVFLMVDPRELREASLRHVREALRKPHLLHPSIWSDWLKSISDAFESGRNLRPLFWDRPHLVQRLLDVTFRLTSTAWTADTLIREASVAILPQSKDLERSKRLVEACLTSMFGQPMSLGMLGITTSQAKIEIAGDLFLHFPDGTSLRIDELRGIYHLTTDLDRACGATTSAKRILTIENSKTTLRRIASLNVAKETLVVACAFPGPGLIRLLKLLPAELPVFHFGDTDPAGFLILSKLRQAIGREVTPFLMERRNRGEPTALTGYDRSLLPGLLEDPFLNDVREHLQTIAASGDKGDFEQESLGRPDLPRWPFYRCHPEATEAP